MPVVDTGELRRVRRQRRELYPQYGKHKFFRYVTRRKKVVAGPGRYGQWLREIGEVLFPPNCVICKRIDGTITDGLCSQCMANVSYVYSPLCGVCGRNFSSAAGYDHICGDCLHGTSPYSLARSITFYEEPVRTLLHRLKYGFDTAVIEPLLKIAGNYDFSLFQDSDYFIPVPLHHQRLKERGCNHAQQLARLFFPERTRDITVDILVKRRKTLSQTTLDATRRRANLKDAFSVKDTEIIKNKKICIVDDVYTTGTTVAECAKTLQRGGAGEVVAITFARVRKK
jgi:ComF family protein